VSISGRGHIYPDKLPTRIRLVSETTSLFEHTLGYSRWRIYDGVKGGGGGDANPLPSTSTHTYYQESSSLHTHSYVIPVNGGCIYQVLFYGLILRVAQQIRGI